MWGPDHCGVTPQHVEMPHLSNPPATAAQPYQPWAAGSSPKQPTPLSSGHDKLCRATPQTQQLRGGSFSQTALQWVLKDWRMGKKELPVLLRDKDGIWMNTQGTQQICFNIQAGIFIQVQVNSAHKLKKMIEKKSQLTWMIRQQQFSGTELKLMGSGQINHERQRFPKTQRIFFLIKIV